MFGYTTVRALPGTGGQEENRQQIRKHHWQNLSRVLRLDWTKKGPLSSTPSIPQAPGKTTQAGHEEGGPSHLTCSQNLVL